MDLSNPKVTDQEKLALCKRYFIVGLVALPFVWMVNAVWFSREAFRRPVFPEQKQIRKFVVMSGLGSLAWFIGLTAWLVIYVNKRTEWGEIGDNISFNIPFGSS